MTPDAHGVDAATSEDVCSDMPTEPDVADPILNPIMVTTNGDNPIVPPDVVITTKVAIVAAKVNDTAETLLAPGATLGTIEATKKPKG